MSEVITNVEMNFSNNGGHTANVTSVLNENIVGGGGMGQLDGKLGERHTFTESKINNLMKQFIAIEETTSEDSNNLRKKSVKYKDETSLLLDSHVLILRGELSNPLGDEQGEEVLIHKHSEHPDSSVDPVKVLVPNKEDGYIFIGKTYSVFKTNYESFPYSLGYHDKDEEEGLIFNKEVAEKDGESRNLNNYNLLYGYKLSELKLAIELVDLRIEGLPDRSDSIFNATGKLSAVLSSIAGQIGYYWYVDPWTGIINFIDSQEAADMDIENPLESGERVKLQNASFTKSLLKKATVHSLVGDFEQRDKEQEEKEERERKTNFYLLPSNKIIHQYFFDVVKIFYGLWASKNWNDFKFDALFYWYLFHDKENFTKLVPQWINDNRVLIPLDDGKKKWPKDMNIVSAKKEQISYKQFGDRGDSDNPAMYYNIAAATQKQSDSEPEPVITQGSIEPSALKLKELIGAFFELIHRSIFVSMTFTEQQAQRREFLPEDLQILGPFKKTARLVDIEELSFMRPILEHFKDGDKVTIKKLLDNAGLPNKNSYNDNEDYVFFGIRNREDVGIKFDKNHNSLLKYEFLNESTVEMFFEPASTSESYVGYREKVKYTNVENGASAEVSMRHAISAAKKRSKKLFDRNDALTSKEEEEEEQTGLGSHPSSRENEKDPLSDPPEEVIRVKYRIKSRAEIDGERDYEDKLDGIPHNEETKEHAVNAFEYKYFNIIENGASGDPLRPVDLITKKAFIGEIKAFENDINQAKFTDEELKSSSQTFYGIEIPEDYDITLNSLSISLAGGQGVTTTINKSTRDLVPVDEQFIVSDFYNKVTNLRSTSPRTTAGQRNILGR